MTRETLAGIGELLETWGNFSGNGVLSRGSFSKILGALLRTRPRRTLAGIGRILVDGHIAFVIFYNFRLWRNVVRIVLDLQWCWSLRLSELLIFSLLSERVVDIVVSILHVAIEDSHQVSPLLVIPVALFHHRGEVVVGEDAVSSLRFEVSVDVLSHVVSE